MIIGEDLLRKALIHIIKTTGIEYYPDKAYVRLHVDPFEYESKVIYLEPEKTMDMIGTATKILEDVDFKVLTHRDYLSPKRNPLRLLRTKTVRLRKRDTSSAETSESYGQQPWYYARASNKPQLLTDSSTVVPLRWTAQI